MKLHPQTSTRARSRDRATMQCHYVLALVVLALLWSCVGNTLAAAQPTPLLTLNCQHTEAITLESGAGEEVARMRDVATQIRNASFPELQRVDWRVNAFVSDYDYFRTRFSLWRFFLPVPMRYVVQINQHLFDRHAPLDGVCAIVAHELVHVRDLSHGNRLRRLGLVRLVFTSFAVRFERRTDLEAIHRGYGPGLMSYRRWIYANIPAQTLARKRRSYFTPEEIELMGARLRAQPELLELWRRHVPLSLEEVRNSDLRKLGGAEGSGGREYRNVDPYYFRQGWY